MSKIAKNTSYLTVAYIFQKITAIVYFAFIARTYTVDSLGKYSFSIFYILLLSIFIDFGLNQVLTREIAKYPDKASQHLSNIFSFKIITGLSVYIFAIIILKLLNYPPQTVYLVLIMGVVMFFDGLSSSISATMRGFQNLKYESISTIIYQATEILLGAFVLIFKLPVYGLALAFLAGSFCSFLYQTYQLKAAFKIALRLTLKKSEILKLIKIALPFFISGIYIKIYSHVDSILLTKIAGDTAMGFYSVPYKMVFSLQVLPMAFAASIYPAFSYFWLNSRDSLKNTFERSFFYLMLIALPLTLGTIALSDQLITKIFGAAYEPSIPSLQILIASLFFSFLTYPVGALLNACDQQKKNTRNVGIVMLASLAINIALIPNFTFIGASIASLASQILLLVLGLSQVPKILKYNQKFLLWSFVKILFCAGIMGLIAYLLKSQINLIINVILAGLIFGSLIFAVKIIKKSDLAEIFKLLKKQDPAALPSIDEQ